MPGPTAETPLSCDDRTATQCVILLCQYYHCSGSGGRRLTNAGVPAATSPADVEGPCIAGCERGEDDPQICENFSDVDCPGWAGCITSDDAAGVDMSPALAPVQPAVNQTEVAQVSMAAPVIDPVVAIDPQPAPAQGVSGPPLEALCPPDCTNVRIKNRLCDSDITCHDSPWAAVGAAGMFACKRSIPVLTTKRIARALSRSAIASRAMRTCRCSAAYPKSRPETVRLRTF